ncbi:MAG TPA: glycosyltransferase [Candidatus Saccharimonadales bacterium]
MRIAFFTDDYLPYVHGVTTSIQNYRQALEAMGHEVWIVAPQPKQKDFVENDDHVIRMPSINSYIFDNRPVSLLYPGIARKLYKYDFDVVHSHTQFYLFVIAGMVARKQNIPHFTSVHTLFTELIDDYPAAVTAGLIAVSIGFPFVFRTKPILPFDSAREIRELSRDEASNIRKKQGWRLIAACVNQADVGIAPSAHLCQTLKENGTDIPLHTLPNGISLERYQQSRAEDSPIKKKPGEQFIVCVARVSGEKRQRVLVESMVHVKTKKTKLVLVGDGPELENLKKLSQELGVENKVIFTGLRSPEEVAAILKQADIFTLASYRFDNQPMVLLEAIASGLPIVYCDDQLTEGLTSKNTLLTDGIESDSFAAAFDELLGDLPRRKKMAEASIAVSKKFDRNALAQKLLRQYKIAQESKYELVD